MEIEQQLRRTSDSMLATLEQLERLETQKREVQPDSPRFRTLASEIERLAAEVFAQTHAQQRLAEASQEVGERAGAEMRPINEVAPGRDLRAILSDWRGAERRVAAAAPDSTERAAALADVRRLRAEYQRAYEAQSGRAAADGGETG